MVRQEANSREGNSQIQSGMQTVKNNTTNAGVTGGGGQTNFNF